MILTESTIIIDPEHSIEFGKAPWDSTIEVIRRRKNKPSGGYDPYSSSTIPINSKFLDIADLVNYCLDFDKIPPHDMHSIQAALRASAARLSIKL